MEDKNIVNKESVEALIALTDLVKKSDSSGKVVDYDIETIELLADLVQNTEGISPEKIEELRQIAKNERSQNQGKVIDFAAHSPEEPNFSFGIQMCSELYEILKHIEKNMVLKLPKTYLDAIINNRDVENPVKYDWDRPLIEQEFEDGTIQFLNWACYEFWLENDEEREVWLKRFDTLSLVEQKETIFEKIKKLL